MDEIKCKIWFYDGEDLATGEWYTLEQAVLEQFVIFENNEMKPFDECSLLVWYTGLKDKNGKGKDIFDQDIFPNFGLVKAYRGCWIVEFPGYNILLHEYLKNDRTREVIGNTFEDVELLGVTP